LKLLETPPSRVFKGFPKGFIGALATGLMRVTKEFFVVSKGSPNGFPSKALKSLDESLLVT